MALPKNQQSYSAKEALQEERYLWMARAFSLVALLALIANFLMLIALSGLMPLVRVQPFYLQTQAKDHQVISIMRPSPEELNSGTLQEALVREYLLARFGIGADKDELERRWGRDGVIFAMSETSVYTEFFNGEFKPLTEQAHNDGLTRDVKILSANRVEEFQNGGVWVAEIELISMNQSVSERDIEKRQVEMEVVFQPSGGKIDWSQRLKNPLGFMVTNFGSKPLQENGSSL